MTKCLALTAIFKIFIKKYIFKYILIYFLIKYLFLMSEKCLSAHTNAYPNNPTFSPTRPLQSFYKVN